MPTDTIRFTGSVSIQAAADGQKAPRVSILAYSGGAMSPAGWPNVAVDLAGADVSGDIPLLAGHGENLDDIAGQGVATIRNQQLFVDGNLTEVTSAGQKVLALARSGINLQASIGFAPDRREHIPAGTKVSLNGRTLTAGNQGMTIIRSGRLREVSLLPIGADAGTSVSIAAKAASSSKGKVMDENENIPTDSEKILAQWNAASFHEPNIRQQTEPILHAALAGKLSIADFQSELLQARLRDSELHVLRAERPKAPTIHGSSRDSGSRQSPTAHIEGALLAHLGHEAIGVKTLGAQTMEQARAMHATSMLDIVKATLQADGRELPQGRDSMIRASFSTHTLTTLLTTVGNKLLLDSYNAFPSAARQIAKKLSAGDFKAHTGFRLTGDAKLEEVGNAGEIKHGTLDQAAYPFSVKTFARMFGLTRQDIINDDLGAFNEIPAMLGRGSAVAIEQAFWTLVLANTASFFHADNNNYISGGTSVLASTGLGLAVAEMLKQTDANGDPINVVPRFLVVPPELKKTADELYRSTCVNTGGAATETQVPNASVFFGLYEPIVSPYISNANYSGNSTTQWYLFGSPSDVAAFGIAYLNGQEAPTIESADTDFNTLGMQFRGYIDFGVCQIDSRGAVKSAGA